MRSSIRGLSVLLTEQLRRRTGAQTAKVLRGRPDQRGGMGTEGSGMPGLGQWMFLFLLCLFFEREVDVTFLTLGIFLERGGYYKSELWISAFLLY